MKRWKIGKRVSRALWALLFLTTIVFGSLPTTACAEENVHPKIVRLGYYEEENFQEGAAPGEYKSGYGYEYEQKIANFAGWKYEYVYGTFQELLEMLEKGKIDLLAGVRYRGDRQRA